MDVLITGINGFIGKNIANNLFKKGHKIIGVGTSEKSELTKICEYHSVSVLNQKEINSLVKNVDIVIHLAAITAHSEIVDKKFKTLDINLNGTKNILNAFNESKRAKKFIYASTGKVYGKIQSLPLTEESLTSPLNVLGKSKLIAEKIIDFYSNDSKTFVVFRIFQAYGPGQLKNFLIPTIISQLNFNNSKNQVITLGDIKAKRDYIFIEDISSAFVAAVNNDISKGINIYNLSSSIPQSANEIIQVIEKLFNLKIQVQVNKNLLRNDEESIEYGSFEKVKKDLGWKPIISIEDGLIKTIKSFR